MNSLESELVVEAPADVVFDVLRDIRARGDDVPAFRAVEINDETVDGFIATMHEHYGGRDVRIVSRFRFERPAWLSYEHIEGPYGANEGKFTLTAKGAQTTVHQIHRTEQDVSVGSELREQWLELMRDQLEAVKSAAERTVA
jgi:ribosome-associated toxin RatA of RatAB toxin-antitoxin module